MTNATKVEEGHCTVPHGQTTLFSDKLGHSPFFPKKQILNGNSMWSKAHVVRLVCDCLVETHYQNH